MLFSSLRFYRESYRYESFERIEMSIYSISPASLSLIGALTTETYSRKGTNRNTNTHRLKLTITPNIGIGKVMKQYIFIWHEYVFLVWYIYIIKEKWPSGKASAFGTKGQRFDSRQ